MRQQKCRVCETRHPLSEPHAGTKREKDHVVQVTAIVLLNESEARKLTERIKTAADDLWRLLYEAHERQAWKPLGYGTWAVYVEAEFDMKRRHSYRLLEHAEKMLALEDIVPNWTQNTIPEGATRAIPRDEVPAIAEEVRHAVQNGAEPITAVKEAIARRRDLPTPGEADDLAREHGLSVPASDGLLHDGRSDADIADAAVTTGQNWTIIRALEALSTFELSPDIYLAQLPDYLRPKVTPHIGPAFDWVERLKEIWQ